MSYDKAAFERTKERVMSRWGDEISHPRLKAKIGFEDSLHELINKCMTCPEEEFDFNVHRLLWSVPDSWRDEEFENDLDGTIEQVEVITPIMNCGVPIKEDVVPGTKETRDETDWRKVFNAIVNLCQRRNLLIPKDYTEVIPEIETQETEEERTEE